jgi:hypothetical protein
MRRVNHSTTNSRAGGGQKKEKNMGHFLDYSHFVTVDGLDMYVYPSGVNAEVAEIFVCSPTPLNTRQVAKAAKIAGERQEEEMVVDALKSGDSPATVWNDFGFSAAHIGRIAKKNGIKLPRNWFQDALCNTERGQQATQHNN